MNCPNCGNKITEHDKVCKQCGNVFYENSSDDIAFAELMQRKRRIILISVISATCAVVAIIIVLIFVFIADQTSEVDYVENTTSAQTTIEDNSTTIATLTVPNVIGIEFSEASQELEKDGFIIQTKYEYSDVIKKDYIVSQTPEAGEQIQKGTTVKIVVSKGLENSTTNNTEDSSYVFYDSDIRYISSDELYDLSLWELEIARNEIYARHGRLFNDVSLQNYFNGKSWYKGTINPEDFTNNLLNKFEIANIDTIIMAENNINNNNDYSQSKVNPEFDIVSASSTLPDQKGFSYSAQNVLNFQNGCWVENKSGVGVGEWIKLESNSKQAVSGINILNGYTDSLEQYQNNGKATKLRFEFSDGSTYSTYISYNSSPKSLSLVNKIQNIDFGRTINTYYIKIVIEDAVSGYLYDDTCISYLSPY